MNKLFQCIYCVKSFAEKLKLKDHVLSIHEGKKSPSEQSTAKKVHEEEKIGDQNKDRESGIFCCRVCGSYFQDIPSLSNHLQNHSQCRTKVHLNFLRNHGILPLSFEMITDDEENSSKIKQDKHSKKLLDLPKELINESVASYNQEDVILGI